eukprot:symbB.v1.2.004330.t1/scaffold188.1/size279614/19
MSGYGESKRRRPSNSRGRSAGRDEKRHKGKKDKKEKKTREGDERSRKQTKRSRSRDFEDAPEPTKADAGPEAVLGRKDSNLAAEKTKAAWREEIEKVPAAESDGEAPDGMAMEDDEDADRKVQESRARREALMAKWVNRGERNGCLGQCGCGCWWGCVSSDHGDFGSQPFGAFQTVTFHQPRDCADWAPVSSTVMGCKGSKAAVVKTEQAQSSTLLETPAIGDKGPVETAQEPQVPAEVKEEEPPKPATEKVEPVEKAEASKIPEVVSLPHPEIKVEMAEQAEERFFVWLLLARAASDGGESDPWKPWKLEF